MVKKYMQKGWSRFIVIFIMVMAMTFRKDISQLPVLIRIAVMAVVLLSAIAMLAHELQLAKERVRDDRSSRLYRWICVLDIILVLLYFVVVFAPLKKTVVLILLAVVFGAGILSEIVDTRLEKYN